jgi:hypothetical protein
MSVDISSATVLPPKDISPVDVLSADIFLTDLLSADLLSGDISATDTSLENVVSIGISFSSHLIKQLLV